MSFKLKPTHDLIQIVSAGGGLRLEASLRPTNELVQLASAAKMSGAKIIFAGLNLRPTADLVNISSAGRGVVFFED